MKPSMVDDAFPSNEIVPFIVADEVAIPVAAWTVTVGALYTKLFTITLSEVVAAFPDESVATAVII